MLHRGPRVFLPAFLFSIFHFLIPILPPLNCLRRGGFRPPSSSSSSRFCEGGARPALLGHSHLRTSPNPAPCHPEPACPERISRRAPFAGERSTFPFLHSSQRTLRSQRPRLAFLGYSPVQCSPRISPHRSFRPQARRTLPLSVTFAPASRIKLP
jgi:hypothetical protein